MTTINCEMVRDVYPDILHGRADATLTARIRAHITTCEDCREETALLDVIHAHSVVVPADLERRVVHAVRMPRRRWLIGRSELAMAATLVFALIGGATILEMQNSTRNETPATAQAAPHLGAVGVEDAMLSGKSSLDDLSVEQLKKLLGEIQS